MYLLFLPVAAFILAIFACRFLAPSPLTYSRLGQATLFPVVKCGSANTKTASYNPRTYSPDPPRFVYNDPSVGYDALARYGNVLNALEMQRRVCPPQTLDSWRPVLKHLEKIKYHDERWVDTLLDHITSFLMPLVEDILPGELEYQYPELSEGQQGGRNIVVEMEHPRINHGIAEESKCTPVLNKLYGDITCPMVLPNGKLEEEKAVMVKIGLQLQKLRTRVPTARHGLILSGTDCYVVELCQTTVGGTVFPGLAVSNRIALSPSSEDDSPVQSLATLVLGLIIPPTVLPYALPRDPSSRADRKTIEAGLKALIARGGANGAGGGGAVGGGGSGGAGDQEGPSGVPPALKLGSAVAMRLAKTPFFNPLQPLLVVDRLDIEALWGPLVDTTCAGLSSRSISPAPSHASCSTAVSDSSEVDSCTTVPSYIAAPQIHLVSTIHSGLSADVARATFHAGNQIFAVVFKTYNATGVDEVVAETRAYESLRDLQGTTVAAQIGIVASPDWAWIGLLMEDAGERLGCREDWSGLSLAEKQDIYGSLVKIHQKGVRHGDVAPRNVVRRPTGSLSFVDFGRAEQHCCPGADCTEVARLKKELKI